MHPCVTPDDALGRLQDGNAKYRWGLSPHPRTDGRRMRETAEAGQHPFAAVLACSDSRVPVELLFHQGIGDLFVVRVAGNVCGPDQAASLEYAVEHLGVGLVVVLGHTRCGAVTAAASGAAPHGGGMGGLLEKIAPAVSGARAAHPDLTGARLIEAAVEANVQRVLAQLLDASPVIGERVAAGTVKVVGAIYDLADGDIRWQSS